VSGYTEVFDLSGNVWEFEDSCEGFAVGEKYCNVRGGSFYSGSLRCDEYIGFGLSDYGENIGFRCCADNTGP
jgi:formylglycine-generating enzyme required for sulfatase activity